MLTAILATVTVDGEAGYAQRIRTAGHELTSDEPVRRGGTDTGPNPVELVLAGLGACTAITLRMYGDRKQWNLGTIHVALRMVREANEQRIERSISFSGALDAAQRTRLLEIAEKTPVSKALTAGMLIKSALQAEL